MIIIKLSYNFENINMIIIKLHCHIFYEIHTMVEFLKPLNSYRDQKVIKIYQD